MGPFSIHTMTVQAPTLALKESFPSCDVAELHWFGVIVPHVAHVSDDGYKVGIRQVRMSGHCAAGYAVVDDADEILVCGCPAELACAQVNTRNPSAVRVTHHTVGCVYAGATVDVVLLICLLRPSGRREDTEGKAQPERMKEVKTSETCVAPNTAGLNHLTSLDAKLPCRFGRFAFQGGFCKYGTVS